MNEKFERMNNFNKDPDNLEMLRQSLKSSEIDKELKPFLRNFLELPITPTSSCYGHQEELNNPYFSYVEDSIKTKQDEHFQNSFKEKINELAEKINNLIGKQIVEISFVEEFHGGKGPREYTMKFEILNKQIKQEKFKEIISTIWSECSKYLDEIGRELIE